MLSDKPCSHCGEIKPRAEVVKDSTKPSGLSPLCKQCHAIYTAKRTQKRKFEGPFCSVDGCGRPISTRLSGLCRGHHVRQQKTGDTGGEISQRYKQGTKKCKYPGCEKASYCRGSCADHYTAARRKQIKMMLVASMGGECMQCGGKFPPACYDFHHLDPTIKKNVDDTVARAINGGTSVGFDRALGIAAQCKLLCSNCHRSEHDAHKLQRIA